MPKFVMSDGRQFTDYNPSCELNKMIQQHFELKDSHEYRNFLQNNQEKVHAYINSLKNGVKDCEFCPVCEEAISKK
jgi:hypothetical protein